MTEPKTISELITLVKKDCKKGNMNNAIIYLNEAIEIDPNDARFYISRGTFRENDEDSIEDNTKAIEIFPKKPNKVYLYNYRASAKRKLGDNEGADEDDKKADKLKSMERNYD